MSHLVTGSGCHYWLPPANLMRQLRDALEDVAVMEEAMSMAL